MTAPIFRSDMAVELQDSMGSEESIVRAARVSTLGSDSRGSEANTGLLKYLYREGHGTPFESCVLTFYIECPIFVSRQIVKHRLSSINETSGRYRELEGQFYIPDISREVVQVGKVGDYEFVPDPDVCRTVVAALKDGADNAWGLYEYMLNNGAAKEVARMVLPVNLYTQLYVTMNLRSWLNFLALRVDWGEAAAKRSHAQHEVEMVAYKVSHVIRNQYPTVWRAFADAGYSAV